MSTLTPDAVIERGLLIGGEEVPAASGETIPVVNRATGDIIAHVAAAGRDDIDRALTVGRRTFDSGVWSELPISERARVIHRFADGMEARIDHL